MAINELGIPSEETLIRIAEATEKIADTRVIADFSNSPGSKYLIAGNRENGFFGIVQSSEFITGDALATSLALTAGTSINSDTPWLKLVRDGKIIFHPLLPLRHSITHDDIYDVGAVYGTGDEGTLPPTGRLGVNLSIVASDNSINTTGHFLGDKTSGMDYADTVCSIGDTVILKNWNNSANNGSFTVVSVTDSKIVLSGGVLVDESNNKNGTIYESTKAVNQNAETVIGGLTYKVRLLKMGDHDPLDSYTDSDRDMVGDNSEWNNLILPLMLKAKTGNWAYPQYAGDVEDWNIGLTDLDMILHHTLGSGSYRWGQEVSNVTSWRRTLRGGRGASGGLVDPSWYVYSGYAFAPGLELRG